MERDYWLEPCGWQECPPDDRLDYCRREIDYAEDEVMEIIEQIDELVEAQSLESNSWHCHVRKDELQQSRNFESDSAFTDEIAIAGVRHGLSIYIEQNKKPTKQTYEVVTDWRITSDDYASAPYSRTYTIELYPDCLPLCTVTEPDLHPEMEANVDYQDRPMTPYDMRELCTEIDRLRSLESADQK